MKRTKMIAGVTALALMLSAGATTAFAAETECAATDKSSYSYLTGQQRSVGRNEIYAQAELIEDEAEREAFLHANGISETAYSEEAAASYSYVTGKARGTSYSVAGDTEESVDKSGYVYIAGQQRGSSYRQ